MSFFENTSVGGGRGRGSFGIVRGRGGFGAADSSETGGFGGGRGRGGGFFGGSFTSNDSEAGNGSFRGSGSFRGRGGFDSSSSGTGHGRGGFGAVDSSETGGFGGGRGGSGRSGFGVVDSSETGGFGGGRGGSGRGGFGAVDSSETGGFGGGRGGRGRGGFGATDSLETGGFGGGRGGRGRGGFGTADFSKTGFGGGRGRGRFGAADSSETDGFGGGRGGRGGGFSGGKFASNNSEAGNGSFRGRGGSFRGRGGANNPNNETLGFGGLSLDRTSNDQQGQGGDENDVPKEDATRAPVNWRPKAREVDALFAEDLEVGENYANVCDDDEEVAVNNFKHEITVLERWEDADFVPEILENLKRCKYIRPRKIQRVAIPLILDEFDVKGHAETGSGKTAAFILPILDACLRAKADAKFVSEPAQPFAIVIEPTRELVMQIYEQATKFACNTGVSIAKAYGQYNISANHAELRNGCDILCGTPGRLKHFIGNGEIVVKDVKFLVLDEADRLLDDNFMLEIRAMTTFAGFPDKENRQTLLFSATFPSEVESFAAELTKSSAPFITTTKDKANKKINQEFLVVQSNEKLDTLCSILKKEAEAVGNENIRRTLVFTNTKRMSDMAALYLCNHQIPASSINGDRGQNLREEALLKFRNKQVNVLVATDVCARGIDIKDLDHVVNFDAPDNITQYIHRIGRTGRIRPGFATTFVSGSSDYIVELVKQNIEETGGQIPESLSKILVDVASMPSYPGFAVASADGAAPIAAARVQEDW